MRASVYEEYYSFQGVRLHYKVWKEAQQKQAPLVLLHGFAQSADSWNDVAVSFKAQHAVYALDLIGHGHSDKPVDSSFYTLEAQGAALRAFLRQVTDETGRRPCVVGYSMGGRVALSALAADVLEFTRVACALVLESAGVGFKTDEERLRATEQDILRARCLRTGGIETFMEEWERLPLFATQQNLTCEIRARVRRDRLANSAEALALTFEQAGQHVMPFRKEIFNALSAFERLGSTTLYLVGALDDAYRHLSESLALLQGVSVKVTANAGHNIHLEAPDLFVATIENFLFGNIL